MRVNITDIYIEPKLIIKINNDSCTGEFGLYIGDNSILQFVICKKSWGFKRNIALKV